MVEIAGLSGSAIVGDSARGHEGAEVLDQIPPLRLSAAGRGDVATGNIGSGLELANGDVERSRRLLGGERDRGYDLGRRLTGHIGVSG